LVPITIETWATCPFRFFLGRVLRIDATDRPEDGWTVDPLERGSLIHRILERFFQNLRAAGRFESLDSYSNADHQQLEQFATECFADLERRGVTGQPLVWESASATIRTDLRTFLIRDERWRRERRLQPRFFEQALGMHRSGSWPSLELDIGGVRVGFRGSIDRVAPRYRAARHGQRSVILDEFVAVTGYDRKYAIRLLLGPIQLPQPIRRPRAAHYGEEVQEALANAWTAANGICGKRLVPFLHELIPHTRTAWAPESVRRGPPASAVAQPGDGGSIAEAAAPATQVDDHQTRPFAQAAHPGAYIHRVD